MVHSGKDVVSNKQDISDNRQIYGFFMLGASIIFIIYCVFLVYEDHVRRIFGKSCKLKDRKVSEDADKKRCKTVAGIEQ